MECESENLEYFTLISVRYLSSSSPFVIIGHGISVVTHEAGVFQSKPVIRIH